MFVHTSNLFFTSPKILRHGADGFSSPPKEVVLPIFIALKNPSPWQGLNQRILGPMQIPTFLLIYNITDCVERSLAA
jgi:hypothetical protein